MYLLWALMTYNEAVCLYFRTGENTCIGLVLLLQEKKKKKGCFGLKFPMRKIVLEKQKKYYYFNYLFSF